MDVPFKVLATAVDWLVVSGDTARFAGPVTLVIRDPAGAIYTSGPQAVKGVVTIHK